MQNQGIIGALIMAIGGFCPLIHIPIVGNWNYFDMDQRLAIAFYVLVVLGLVASFIQKASFVKFVGWSCIGLVALTLGGVYFKSHNYFSFIHFKKLISLATGIVKYKWGWFVILAGAFTLITVRRPNLCTTER